MADISVDQAIARVLELGEAHPALDTEIVTVTAAIGRVLGEPMRARWALPSAPLSIMDGYALRSADAIAARERGANELALRRVDESAAGHPSEDELGPGCCVRIATGAVIPAGADAVVPQEDTRVDDGRVVLGAVALEQCAAGRFIRPIGSDVEADELLAETGASIGGGEASLLAGTGHVEIPVVRRPKVAILSSGDELVPIGQTPAHGQIVSTNAMLLAAAIVEAGGEVLDLGNVPDEMAAVCGAIEQARAGADLLLCSGGISVGDHDLILPALEQLGFDCRFRKVALRPGRPTTFGTLARSEAGAPALPILALPGNPASTLVAFELFARPLIRALLGLSRHRWQRPWRATELAAEAEGDRQREHFVRAAIDEQGRARPLAKQLSGALRSIANFELLLRVPAGRTHVEAGETLPAMFLRE